MSTVLANTKELTREEWLEHRKKGIGGSDAAAIAGLNPWRSPVEVYMDKIGEIDVPDEENEAMYWGNRLEDLVAEEFQRRTVKKVWRKNAILQHKDHEFMIANLDRRVVGEAEGIIPLEVKTTSEWKRDEWNNEEIPDMYAIQIHHYIAVCRAPYAYVAVLIGGNKFCWKRIERDQEIIDYLVQIEKDFWENHVLAGEPPEFDGSDASSELLKKMYPGADPGSRITLPIEVREHLVQCREWTEKEKEAREKRKEAENKIKSLLGEKEVGLLEGEPVVTWKQVVSRRTDTKKLRKEYPDIAEKCSYESTYRRLIVNG